MKTGRSLVELATEIQRQAEAKKDYIVPTSLVAMELRESAPVVKFGEESFGLKQLAHRQLGEYLGIPAKYYDRMVEEQPELLVQNVNTWLKAQDEKRMVRTLDGQVRAMLSDRYRPLENAELAEAVLPVLSTLEVEIMSCEVTETRLYIKAVDKRITKDIPTGRKMGDGSHVFFDTLSPAIVISNSEVGFGALSVEAGVWTRLCTNLAIAAQRSMKKYHVGGKHEITDGLYQLLSDKTRRLSDAATWAQVSDVVRGAFEQARFDALVNDIQGMTDQKITGDPVKVIEVTGKQFSWSEGERTSVLRHLIEGGDLSRYGLFNAVTRTAEDLQSYDRATDFEKMGGQIIELKRNEWEHISAVH